MKARKNSARELNPRARKLLAMQGLATVPDNQLRAIRPWLRVAPAITAAWLLLGTLTQSPEVLWVLVPFAALGAILPTHPFDVFYNHCARFVLGQPILPQNPIQRRICCGIASGWAVATAVLFQTGHTGAAMITGCIATTGCALPALTDFCVPSFVMQLLGFTRESCVIMPEIDPRSGGTMWQVAPPPVAEPVTHTLFVSGGGRPC